MTLNSIRVQRFTRPSFVRALAAASGGDAGRAPEQVKYLARYCAKLGARTVVQEHVYVDRHYMDEYAAYYSRMLTPPKHTVIRFHVFGSAFTARHLRTDLADALSSPSVRVRVQKRLSQKYLGFVSVRPLAAVPVGRTVLQKLRNGRGRHREIWATANYSVHLANLQLNVNGLAFQQQDLAVGACATAALWSALSRVARREAMRAPTPAEVSEAAAKHLIPEGRAQPAVSGLTISQLCEAVRASGFAPERMHALTYPEIFMIGLHTYLLSGIPVLLALRSGGEGHAVTAVGFQVGPRPHPVLQASIPVRSAYVTKLYVHDDRLGPYARAHVHPRPRTKTTRECLILGIDWPDRRKEPWLVDSAIAPVYPKMRLSVRSLVTLAEMFCGVMEHVVGASGRNALTVEFLYKRSGEYLAELSGRVPRPSLGSADFLQNIVLPRWCAVMRWYVAERPLCEFVFDTTDILRTGDHARLPLLRALVCFQHQYAKNLALVSSVFGARFLG